MTDQPSVLNGTEPPALTLPPTQSTSSTGAKRKRKSKPSQNATLAEFSLRKPTWSYLHLQLLSSTGTSTEALDAVTAHLRLQSALSAFLGLHGTAIPTDILKLRERDVWIRVPAEDRVAVVGALGGWVSGSGEGWRVRGWSSWHAGACGRGTGQNLFE